jgi:hypothetical protein
MCCFSAKTEVHGTNIFARLTSPDAQVLVYQMQYSSAEPTAMILPLPVALPAGESSIAWKNLKDNPGFFEQLAAGFPELPHFSLLRSKGPEMAAAMVLPVHEVGDFVASFVPTIEDFSRIDPRFVISKEVWRTIPEYKDYGFAVFQLKELSGSPHPMAFEFRTRMRDAVYFPTVHIHDGTVHREDAFDHALYLQDSHFDEKARDYKGPTEADPRTGFVRSKDSAASFAGAALAGGLVDGALLVHRRTMRGLLPNKDTIVSLLTTAASSGCGHCDVAMGSKSMTLGPAAFALAGLSWVIRRRNRRRGARL